MSIFIALTFLDIIIICDSQFYQLTKVKEPNELQGLLDSERICLHTDRLDVSSTDNISVGIINGRLSFLEETDSLDKALHTFRLNYEENKAVFVHITLVLPNGSYPKTYTEFKKSVFYTEEKSCDRKSAYKGKNFVLFFIRKKSFLKLPSGRYTPKYAESRKFSELELKFLDTSTKAFFRKVDEFTILAIELSGSINVLGVDDTFFLYGVFYINAYDFLEENGVFKPHPDYLHIITSQKVEINQIKVAEMFVINLSEKIELKMKFEKESFVLRIVEISGFVEVREENFDFYNVWSKYDTRSSFPVQVFEAIVSNSSIGFGFFLYPSLISFNLLPTDFFAFFLLTNFSLETSEGILDTKQIPIYLEVFNKQPIPLHTMVFKDQKIGNWLTTIEFGIKSCLYDEHNFNMQIEVFVARVAINGTEATIQKVEKYGAGGLTDKQEIADDLDSITHKVAEKLCLYVNNSWMQRFVYKKYQESVKSFLKNNFELAQECNRLKRKIREKENFIKTKLHCLDGTIEQETFLDKKQNRSETIKLDD